MPFVTAPYDGTSIYYAVHGGNALPHADPRPKVVLLMGFAASSVAWAPQLADLLCGTGDDQTPAMAVCVLDNRGIGRSGAPTSLTAYSTGIMALDVLQVMNELGWEKFHVVGHSMGGMIAMLVAATAPERVASLTVISVTAGRWQAVPRTVRSMWLGLRLLCVRSPEARAAIDVRFHFSSSLLHELDPDTGRPREDSLIEEYVAAAMAQSGEGQPVHGMRGQLAAVFMHGVRGRHIRAIQRGTFPCVVIHGREDIIAPARYGRRLAARLQAPYVQLEGGHFVMREQAAAVNALLRSLVLGTSFANVERYPWFPFQYWVKQVKDVSSRQLAAATRAAVAAKRTIDGLAVELAADAGTSDGSSGDITTSRSWLSWRGGKSKQPPPPLPAGSPAAAPQIPGASALATGNVK